MEEKFFIQTIIIRVQEDNADAPIDLAAIGGVIDFSIENPVGSSSCTVNINGITSHTLAAGDPMLMLGGYHNCLREDKIYITFSGGTGNAFCYLNKRTKIASCLN